MPSRLADRLAAGELDVALIPVIEYFRGGGYSDRARHRHRHPRPGAERHAVQPRAVGRNPPVALDDGSRTSAALAQILLRERYGVQPEILPLPLDADAEDVDADAVLLIGDRAMRACLPGFRYAFDLGQEWHDWTGLPFVYAVWAVRPGADLGGVEAALQEAKGRGLEHVGAIAAGRGRPARAGRRLLPALPGHDHPLRPRAARAGRAAPLLHLACELGLARRARAVRGLYSAQAEPAWRI